MTDYNFYQDDIIIYNSRLYIVLTKENNSFIMVKSLNPSIHKITQTIFGHKYKKVVKVLNQELAKALYY